MNGRFVIALYAKDTVTLFHLSNAAEVYVSSIVVGELFYGAYKSQRVADNLRRTGEFINANQILSCDSETARFYGQVKNELKTKGHPIPENDVWIAAIALQHQLTLVTRDAHFATISNLALATWQ
jgi:tRNA(fMet)-specific endonuclease VapC